VLEVINGPGALTTELDRRLRVGVGRGDGRRDLADHVLGRFEPEERPDIEDATVRAADAVETFVDHGLSKVMASYNGST